MLKMTNLAHPHLQTLNVTHRCKRFVKVNWLKYIRNVRISCSFFLLIVNLFKKLFSVCWSILSFKSISESSTRGESLKSTLEEGFCLTSWSLGMTAQKQNNVFNQPQGKSFPWPQFYFQSVRRVFHWCRGFPHGL